MPYIALTAHGLVWGNENISWKPSTRTYLIHKLTYPDEKYVML
jgi:hypothetical protein